MCYNGPGIVLFFPLSFTGFLIRDIPVYFECTKYISHLGLATAMLLENELKGLSLNYNGAKSLGDELLGDTPLDDPVAEDTRLQAKLLINSWITWVKDVLCHLPNNTWFPDSELNNMTENIAL